MTPISPVLLSVLIAAIALQMGLLVHAVIVARWTGKIQTLVEMLVARVESSGLASVPQAISQLDRRVVQLEEREQQRRKGDA